MNKDMDNEENHHEPGSSSIISSVCWVDRGYAKAILDEYQPDVKEIQKHKKYAKKLLKGADPNNVDIAEAKKKIEENMNDKDMDWDEQSDEADDMPIFTSELAKLKEKELGN